MYADKTVSIYGFCLCIAHGFVYGFVCLMRVSDRCLWLCSVRLICSGRRVSCLAYNVPVRNRYNPWDRLRVSEAHPRPIDASWGIVARRRAVLTQEESSPLRLVFGSQFPGPSSSGKLTPSGVDRCGSQSTFKGEMERLLHLDAEPHDKNEH